MRSIFTPFAWGLKDNDVYPETGKDTLAEEGNAGMTVQEADYLGGLSKQPAFVYEQQEFVLRLDSKISSCGPNNHRSLGLYPGTGIAGGRFPVNVHNAPSTHKKTSRSVGTKMGYRITNGLT